MGAGWPGAADSEGFGRSEGRGEGATHDRRQHSPASRARSERCAELTRADPRVDRPERARLRSFPCNDTCPRPRHPRCSRRGQTLYRGSAAHAIFLSRQHARPFLCRATPDHHAYSRARLTEPPFDSFFTRDCVFSRQRTASLWSHAPPSAWAFPARAVWLRTRWTCWMHASSR